VSQGSLLIVGTGIQLVGQMTLEAISHIQAAERFFHVGGNPLAVSWLQSLNPSAEGLYDSYAQGKPRWQSYREMVDRILTPVREGRRVVAAFYGHPGVGVTPAHAAVAQARHEGFQARMLPAVSADACLFADLGFDPVQQGCQSYEATGFVHWQPRIDTRIPLVLWQIGVVDEDSIRLTGKPNLRGLRKLVRALESHYSPGHRVVCYEASWFFLCDPVIQPVEVHNLPRARITSGTTLFVPPLQV
jgi:hypothetical protein